MSLPKTIVLTAIPNKLPLNRSNMDSLLRSNGGCQMSVLHLKREVSSSEDDISPAPIRKRQKLDHLSSEEKIQRRKLKNRVAAQCARDRKKARMSSLEDQVAVLELEKKTLLKENFILKQRNQQLEKENQKLKNQRLQQQPEQTDEKPLQSEQTTVLHVKTEEDSIKFLGHALPINVPLQQEQELQLFTLLMMQFGCLQMIVNLMIYLNYYNSVVKNCSKTPLFLLPQQIEQIQKKIQEINPKIKWWGPHQKTWNPSKN